MRRLSGQVQRHEYHRPTDRGCVSLEARVQSTQAEHRDASHGNSSTFQLGTMKMGRSVHATASILWISTRRALRFFDHGAREVVAEGHKKKGSFGSVAIRPSRIG